MYLLKMPILHTSMSQHHWTFLININGNVFDDIFAFDIFRYLSPHLYDFLEALITQQTSPEEAYKKFDSIASKHTEQLRKFTKQV